MLHEYIEQVIEQEQLYTNEGRQGVRNLSKLVSKLDRSYMDIEAFLSDNSGAVEAIIDWISKQSCPEWKDNIENEYGQLDVDEDEDE